MPRKNDAWGIEVGANAIKAMRLVRKGEDITVADYDVLPFKKVLTAPDVNAEEQIQLGLDQLLSRHDLSKSNLVVSVPGHMAFARFTKLPPVDPKKIPDIVKFEAVQQIPFPIDQVEWDYQLFAQPDAPDVEVAIVAITKERVAQFLGNYQAVGLQVDAIVLSPLAVYNAIAYDLELTPESPGVIIMDVGTTSTDVIIVEESRVWLRTLPIGGNHFTEALVRSFKLSFSKAERLKREAGTSKYARQIFQAMRPVFADLLQEVNRSLGYYQSLNRDAKLTRLIGVGSTFRLPGMQKFLKQQLQIDVVRPDGFRRVKVEDKQASDLADEAVNLVTAYGLALQGLGLEKVTTNILPVTITKRKLWRAKQPWFAAAAAALILAAGAAGTRYWIDRNAFYTGVREADGFVSGVVNRAKGLKDEFNSVRGAENPMPEIENYRALLDYRDVWPNLLYDITEAIETFQPQPALLTSDYEQIRAIPLEQRRRLFIKSITSEYAFEADPAIAEFEADREQKEAARQEQAAAAAAANPAAASAAPGEAAADDNEEQAFERWAPDEPSPVFTITITGTTPYHDTPNELHRTLIRWLQSNAERTERPYRIFPIADPELERLEPPPAEAAAAGARQPGGRQPTAGWGANTQRPGGARPPGAWGMGADEGTMVDPRRGGGNQRQPQAQVEVPDLLARPSGPDFEERGWSFVIRFKVQLLKPQDVRRVVPQVVEGTPDGEAPRAGSPPAPQQPADAQTPATPAQAAADRREERL